MSSGPGEHVSVVPWYEQKEGKFVSFASSWPQMFASSAYSSAVAIEISMEKLSPIVMLFGKSTGSHGSNGESQSMKTATALKQIGLYAAPGFSIVTYLPVLPHATSYPSVMSSKLALQGGLTKGSAEFPTLTWYPVLQG